jgi:CheY-like chemotaxis protein
MEVEREFTYERQQFSFGIYIKQMRMWVLQIDDDEDDLEIFSAAIQLFDPAIKYRGISNMEAARSIFDKDDCVIPDVVFLDINMPRYSGFDCYAIFKKDPRFINTHFIFLSTTINPKQMPADAAFMKKQHSLKAYVAALHHHLPSPPPSSSYPDVSYQYRPSLSVFDTMRLTLQPTASQCSSTNELN